MRKVTYRTSQQLAEEHGAFDHYPEMEEQGKPYDYKPRRNAVLLAIAPTASISIISGTTSSIDSYFSNLYSRDTLSGKYMVINRQLIEDLENKGMWNDDMARTIKANNGSVQPIRELDGIIDKDLYKTAYEIDPKRQIDIAAAFQESIDQSVSKSLYIDEKRRDNMKEIYLYAWEKKLKSTYYCFVDKTVKGEKYTEEVNKRGSRRGFGSASSRDSKTDNNSETEQEEERAALEAKARKKFGDKAVDQALNADEDSCPTDPMLRRICPSCE